LVRGRGREQVLALERVHPMESSVPVQVPAQALVKEHNTF